MMQKQELPSGWRKQKLADLANVKGGKRLPKGRSLVSENTGYPYIRVTDMHDGGVSLENVLFIPQDIVAKISRYRIFTEDIFITVAGTLGVVGEIPQELNGANLTENADRITDINCDKKFLLQVLRSSFIQGIIKSTQTQNAQPKLAIERINTFPILLPPQPEQKAIAALLSTWDEAIEKTERLIQVKEKRFKWLLNDLIHVPTKEEMWKQVRMKSLFKERKEGNRGDLPLLSITNSAGVIPHSETNRKDSSNKDKSKYLRICSGDIGYNTMRMWQGVSALSTLEGIVSPAYTICIPGEKLHSQFVAYLFKTPFMIHRFYRYSQGLTSDTWNLKFRHFSEVKMPLPSLEEQQQISETLSSAQQEIDLLKQLADKYKTQKRGLMQKMLTGEWRVKPEIVNQYREA